ncbi:MAG: OmpA family protein [Thermodesulfobacteriota bacterium]
MLTLFLLPAWLVWTGPAGAASGLYSLHVSSHREAAAAQAEVDRLKSQGLEAFVRYETVPGKGKWHRVYVGSYTGPDQAVAAAGKLKAEGVITYCQVVPLNSSSSEPRPAPTEAPERAPDGTAYSPFKRLVYGRYVASFRYRHLAEAEAEGLTKSGWPASVQEEVVQGVPWYRVYLLPQGRRYSGRPASEGLKGFDIIADMSDTYAAAYASDRPGESRPFGPRGSRCLNYTRQQTKMVLLRKFNAAVPEAPWLAALRKLGYKRLDSFEAHVKWLKSLADHGGEDPKTYTYRLWGVMTYHRTEFGDAIGRLEPSDRNAPKAPALRLSRQELDVIPGRKALIILSDFNRKFQDNPVAEARELKKKYGPDLCFYAIYVEADQEGVALAREVAQAGECGNYYDGCRLLTDEAYFERMIREIFYGEPALLAQAECAADTDRDGVCDENDQCPDTPAGALVDERGCWIAALDAFFDFDRAVIKPEYLPGIKWAADVLQANPGLTVEVAGHTDSAGPPAYNLRLGWKRAEAVKAELVKFGVSPARLKVKSYGETKPAQDNSTPTGRARNRRVEIHVLK